MGNPSPTQKSPHLISTLRGASLGIFVVNPSAGSVPSRRPTKDTAGFNMDLLVFERGTY